MLYFNKQKHMKKIFWFISLALAVSPVSTFAAQKQLQAVADSVVDHASPTRNYNGEMLEVAARNIEKQTFIRFNTANEIPRGSTINRAYLKLYTWGDGCYGGIQSMNVKAVRITRSWNEGTITWNNSPDTSTSGMSSHTIPIREDTRYEIWDVTNIVKSWVEQGTSDYGFKLYYYNGSAECSASFFPRELGSTTQKPYLAVDYTPQVNLRDVFPPIISNVSVEHLSTTAVDVHWTTNEAATTKVEFGGNGVYDRSSPTYTGYRTAHIGRVDGLQQDTTYNYRIISVDAAGNKGVLDNQTFTTFRDGSLPRATPSSAPSTPAPTSNSGQSGIQLHIQNIISDVTSPTTAKIKWYSRPSGTSWVFASSTAGPDAPISEYGSPHGQNDDTENHLIFLSGLSPSTTYSFRVATRTNDNQWKVSEINKFTTLAAQRQSAGDPQTSNQDGNNLDNGSGDANSDTAAGSQEAEDTRREVINFLDGDTTKADTTNSDKETSSPSSSAQPASKLTLVIWTATRMLIPLIIFILIILFIIFWLKRRKKEDTKTQAPVSQNGTKKGKTIIFIVIAILILLALKIASFFFPFL